MADLDLRENTSNIYSNVEDSEALPLFIRYSGKDAKFHDNNSTVPFADIIAALSGVHNCYFIHRQQRGKKKVYEELAIKIDEQPYCMTAQLSIDETTLRTPHFTTKNMILPEDTCEYSVRKCDVKFVDFNEDSFKLFSDAGPYWSSHRNEVKTFFQTCFELPIPQIEIRIEEDKEMWQAYLDGLNAILENKRDLIRIQSVTKQKGGLLKLDFDMKSYAQNLQNAVLEELSGKCDEQVSINIDDTECVISFDSYQVIPEDTIENIKSIGRDYCYLAESTPSNTVSGSISIVSNPEELKEIISSIESELEGFGVSLEKTENGEFHLSSDKPFVWLKKIVDTKYEGIANVVNTTRIVMPLLPSADSLDLDAIQQNLPNNVQVRNYNNHLVLSSRLPLNTELDIFETMRFSSCKIVVSLEKLDTHIDFPGAAVKNNTYSWILNDQNELRGLGRFYEMVREKYPNQNVHSTFNYAFAPQINKSLLQDLRLNYYANKSIVVDVPRSCVIFTPQSLQEYESQITDFFNNLDAEISANAPEYHPTAKIDFLCENEDFRRSVFEKVNVALADKRENFTENKISKDGKELTFEFTFNDIEERDNIECSIENALSTIHGIKISYEDDNKQGITTWTLSEDPSLLQELEKKLQSDFRNELVNYINGKEFDKLDYVSDEELSNSRYSKESIVKYKKNFYLKKNSHTLGKCTRRCRDYATIELKDEMSEILDSTDFKISAGDYIQFPAMGKTIELLRQKVAMDRILKPSSNFNRSPINTDLPNFIFDPKYAAETVVNIEEIKEDIRAHKLGNLNEKQLEAVTKSVLAQDLALIQGPPGTGKTTVIAEIIWQAIRKNPDCKILLTSQTNLAVDNALGRLLNKPGIRPVRIGKPDKFEPEGRRFSLPIMSSWNNGREKFQLKENLFHNTDDNASNIWIDRIVNRISNDPKYADAVSSWKAELMEKDQHSRSEFFRIYKNNVNLVAATCSICGSPDFYYSYVDMFGECDRNNMSFDIVIMDEASKATPLEMAVPLVLGKKIIVIGDHKQLPPMMDDGTIDSALEKIGRKDLADKLKTTESQFKRMFKAAVCVRKTIVSTLDTQYRMHENIMNTIKQFYRDDLAASGGLKCGIVDTMDIPDLSNRGSRWHGITIDPVITPDDHAVWINVKTPETCLKPGYKNEGELKAIDLVLRALNKSEGFKNFQESQKTSEDKEIGIITFYSGQSREIKKRYKDKPYRMDVVDRFQGMERNIVIISTVRSNLQNQIGFAKEIERINVAFSRARRLLIVVGNKEQFASYEHYAESIENMKTVEVEQLLSAVR